MSDQNHSPSAESDDDARLAAYDLDEDGTVSLGEDARARLGIIDARLAAIAAEPGLKGKVAGIAHRIVDKIDND